MNNKCSFPRNSIFTDIILVPGLVAANVRSHSRQCVSIDLFRILQLSLEYRALLKSLKTSFLYEDST